MSPHWRWPAAIIAFMVVDLIFPTTGRVVVAFLVGVSVFFFPLIFAVWLFFLGSTEIKNEDQRALWGVLAVLAWSIYMHPFSFAKSVVGVSWPYKLLQSMNPFLAG